MANVGDPAELIRLARDLEAAGWDGFFVWDHVQIMAGAGFEVHDPWMLLAGVAIGTERMSLGAMVTPPARRRPWQLAKQIVTLDHLSNGRAIVGIGLGFPDQDEFGAFGEPATLAERAARTDEAMEIVDLVLRGEPVDHSGRFYDVHAHLHPAAVQRPRPRIWAAATPPHRKPLQRARRWDGVFCNLRTDDFQPPRPDELRDYLLDLLEDPTKDVAASPHSEHSPEEYEAIGVDWLVDLCFPGPDWIPQARQRFGLE